MKHSMRVMIMILACYTYQCGATGLGGEGSLGDLECGSGTFVTSSACNQQVSQSFMFTRPLNENIAMIQSMRHYFLYSKKGDLRGAMELTGAGQASQSEECIARYFLPDRCVKNVLVAGDDFPFAFPQVRAEWLGLPSDFSGEFSISPEQQQMGFILCFNQDLGHLFDNSLLEDTWFNVEMPILTVHNSLNLKQFALLNARTNNNQGPGDIIQAFNQPAWLYGKIPAFRSTVNVSELNFKFGRSFMHENNFLIAYYSVLSVPTGNQQNPAYLFDAVAGYNHHVGIGAGTVFQLLLTREPTDKYAALFFLELEALFLINHEEQRTFDLKYRPWSRYLLLTNRNGPVGNTVPGVNVLTRAVKAHPFGFADFSTGLRILIGRFEVEVGYDAWGHASECIQPLCPLPPDYGIAGNATGITQNDLPGGVYTVTASLSTIAKQAPNDTDAQGNLIFIPIVQGDIDLHSASSRAAFTQKFHIVMSFHKVGKKIDGVFGFGVFFEYPHNQYNTALKNAGGWAKVGASF